MEVLWVAVIAITNFVSVFLAVGTMRYLDYRRKRKVAEFLMNEIGEKISTEMNFQDIVNRLREQEEREGER